MAFHSLSAIPTGWGLCRRHVCVIKSFKVLTLNVFNSPMNENCSVPIWDINVMGFWGEEGGGGAGGKERENQEEGVNGFNDNKSGNLN